MCDLAGRYSHLAYRYAYFHHLPQADLPYIKIPLHTVIKLTPKAYGCDEERYVVIVDLLPPGHQHFTPNLAIPPESSACLHADVTRRYALPIQAVDTHRPKPKVAHQPAVVATTIREYFTEGE